VTANFLEKPSDRIRLYLDDARFSIVVINFVRGICSVLCTIRDTSTRRFQQLKMSLNTIGNGLMADIVSHTHANVSNRNRAPLLGNSIGISARSTQPCIPPGSLNRVPASAGVKAGMSPLLEGR